MYMYYTNARTNCCLIRLADFHIRNLDETLFYCLIITISGIALLFITFLWVLFKKIIIIFLIFLELTDWRIATIVAAMSITNVCISWISIYCWGQRKCFWLIISEPHVFHFCIRFENISAANWVAFKWEQITICYHHLKSYRSWLQFHCNYLIWR